MTSLKTILFCSSLALLMTACGGGGTSNSTTTQTTENQTTISGTDSLGNKPITLVDNPLQTSTSDTASIVNGTTTQTQSPSGDIKMEASSANNSKVLELPDGTKIVLNRSSNINYEEPNNGTEKNIKLKGEAYFEMKQTTIKVKKFNVYAGDTRTTVVGTKFNLRAYDNENVIVLSVLEGEVEFVVLNTQNRQMVQAGERVIYNRKDQSVRKEKITDEAFKWWISPSNNSNTNSSKDKQTSAECASQFVRNVSIKGQKDVQTNTLLLINRTDGDYTLYFSANNKGTMGNVTTSVAGIVLEKGDQFMFVSETDEKRAFDFVGDGTKQSKDGINAYSNNFKVDAEGMRWLANNKIKQFRTVKTIDKKMYPQPLGANKMEQLQRISQCFLEAIE